MEKWSKAELFFFIEAAEEENLDLPYSCRFGACASCVGKLESGSRSIRAKFSRARAN